MGNFYCNDFGFPYYKDIKKIKNDLENVIQNGAGKSAYQVAVENGFVGTEAEWITSLKGESGTASTAIDDNTTNGSQTWSSSKIQSKITFLPITNLAVNGNFASGVASPWTSSGGTLSVVDGAGQILSTGGYPTFIQTTSVAGVTGNIVYFRFKYYYTGTANPSARIRIQGTTSGDVTANFSITKNSWIDVSMTLNAPTIVGNYKFSIYAINSVSGDTLKIKDVCIIDLTTTYETGNEPSLSNINSGASTIPSAYFEGISDRFQPKKLIDEIQVARVSTPKATTYTDLDSRFETIENDVINETNKTKLTATNVITNGNFSSGTTNWANIGSTMNTDTDGILLNNLTSTTPSITQNTTTTVTTNKFFVKAKVYIPIGVTLESMTATFNESLATNSVNSAFNLPTPGTWTDCYCTISYSSIVQPTSIIKLTIAFKVTSTLAEASIKLKNVAMINLTSIYGIGYETAAKETTQLLEELYPSVAWFNGTVDLFDVSNVIGTTLSNKNRIKTLEDTFTTHLTPKTRRWASMGDSITAFSPSYVNYANDILKTTLTNYGYSGASMAVRNSAQYDPYCFATYTGTIDWTQYDYVTEMYGTNDFGNSFPIGTIDSVDTTTFYGAMNVGIQNIYASNPSIKILLITPIWRSMGYSENMLNYVNAVKNIGTKYHIPVFDAFSNCGINSLNQTAWLADELHLNTDGRKRFGEQVAGQFQSLLSP